MNFSWGYTCSLHGCGSSHTLHSGNVSSGKTILSIHDFFFSFGSFNYYYIVSV